MQEENANFNENKEKLIRASEGLALAALPMEARREYGYGYGQGGTPVTRQMHLRDYWRIIRRRLWIPISVVFLAVTLMTIYMLRLPNIYEGRSTLQIDKEDTRTFTIEKLGIGSEDALYLNTQIRNLQSPVIAFQVAKALDLEHNPKFELKKSRTAVEKQKLQVSSGNDYSQSEMMRLESYIDELLGNVAIQRTRDTRLVEIRYRHKDQELAKRIADSWADTFRQNDLLTRRSSNNESDQFLDERIKNATLDLATAEKELMEYRRRNGIIDFGDKESTQLARLAGLNQALLEAENERKSLQGFYELAQKVDPATLPEVQNNEYVRDLNRRLAELNQKRQELLVTYTPEWPDVQQADKQITLVAGELKNAQERIVSSINNRYRAALQREESVKRSMGEQNTVALQQNAGAIQAKMLQQKVDANRTVLEKLMQSKKELEVNSASIKSNIRVATYSAFPRAAVGPKRTQNIALTFLLSLIGGLGLALFLDYLNNKIESVEDVDRYLQLPALGVIPALSGVKARKLLAGATSNSKELAPAGLNSGKLANGQVILTQVEATSSLAESYRQLRTAVLLSSAEHAPRTILVTSSQPTEGKTTTSVNLAISLAQTGSSVIIIDADLRRPRVHKIFSLRNNKGSCNYLAGEGDLASLIQTAMPNLYVLPVGPLPPNPAELLGSTRMRQMIELLSSNFDYVIVDSPPIASFADGLILSSMVEGVIMVVKAGVTPREMAQRTRMNLHAVGAKVLGVVVNHAKLQPHDYYYYSSYYGSYYTQEDESDTAHSSGKEKEMKERASARL